MDEPSVQDIMNIKKGSHQPGNETIPDFEINSIEGTITLNELKSDIVYNETQNFEKENIVSSIQKETNNKIKIISVRTILPDNNNKMESSRPKQQYCLFCDKLLNRFGRHITSVHKQEELVKTIISLEKKSEQRKKLIDKLRTKGNYLYNDKNETSEICGTQAHLQKMSRTIHGLPFLFNTYFENLVEAAY